jgi:phage-related protein
VGLGTNKLGSEIKQAFGGSGDIGESAGKEAGSRFGGAVGIAAAAIGALGIGSFFKSAVSGAADLEQSVGAVDAVFKGSAGQIHEWASTAATDVGLTQNEFNELGTLIGSQLKNGGTAMEELAPKTKSLITLGSDLSSMFGGTTSEAVEALSSALKGERDPIERYGVSLNQAKIDAEAAALGFSKVGGSLSDEATQAATLSLIMKQTADAHGNFGRETDTLAHKQQVLNAQWANGKARIGAELLPVVSAFTGILSSALGPALNGTVAGIKEVVGGFRAFGAAFKAADGDITSSGFPGFMERIAFGAAKVAQVGKTIWAGFKMPADVAASFGSGLNPLLAFGQTVRTIFDQITFTAKTLWAGFKMPADVVASLGSNINPILALGASFRTVVDRITAAGGALAAGFKMPLDVANSFGDKLNPMLAVGVRVRETFVALGAALSGVWAAIGPHIAALVPQVFSLVSALSPASLIFQALLPVLPQIATAIGSVLAAVLPLALSLTSQLLPIITQLISAVLPPLISIFADVVTSIAPLIAIIAGLLIPIIQALMPVVVTVFSVVADVIKSAMQIVQGVIQVVSGAIRGDWQNVWTGVQNIFQGVWNTIGSIVRGALQLIGQVVISGLGLVLNFVTSTLASIGNFFINAFNGMANNTSSFIGNLIGMFASLPGRIMGALGGLAGMLVGVGRNMIQGLIDGVGGMINNAVQAVRNVGGAMLDGIKGFLGIKSPSRVFKAQVGMMIGAGVIAGVNASQSGVTAAVNGLVTVPQVPAYSAGAYTPAGALTGAPGAGGFNNYGTIHVRDEDEMARVILTRQQDALAVYR